MPLEPVVGPLHPVTGSLRTSHAAHSLSQGLRTASAGVQRHPDRRLHNSACRQCRLQIIPSGRPVYRQRCFFLSHQSLVCAATMATSWATLVLTRSELLHVLLPSTYLMRVDIQPGSVVVAITTDHSVLESLPKFLAFCSHLAHGRMWTLAVLLDVFRARTRCGRRR